MEQVWDRVYEILPAFPDTVHEYGCGQGDGLKLLSDKYPGATIAGIDISEEQLKHVRSKYPDLDVWQGDIQQAVECADVIFVLHTLEPHQYGIDQCATVDRLLGLCGYLVIACHTKATTEDSVGFLDIYTDRTIYKDTYIDFISASREEVLVVLRGDL